MTDQAIETTSTPTPARLLSRWPAPRTVIRWGFRTWLWGSAAGAFALLLPMVAPGLDRILPSAVASVLFSVGWSVGGLGLLAGARSLLTELRGRRSLLRPVAWAAIPLGGLLILHPLAFLLESRIIHLLGPDLSWTLGAAAALLVAFVLAFMVQWWREDGAGDGGPA